MKDKKLIPPGTYCYIPLGLIKEQDETTMACLTCPYWSLNDNQPEQCNGYCAYLEEGDWGNKHLALLWDMVKECGWDNFEDEELAQKETDWMQYMLDQGKVPADRIELVKKRIAGRMK